jgi:transcriptional regulator with XRE-family HTH domain
MRLEDHRQKLEQESEYITARKELQPFLDLANELLDLRLEKGWSQTELARRAGTRQANISRIESGVANPTLKSLQRLAQALDTELTVNLKPRQPEVRTKVVYIPVQDSSYWARRERTSFTWQIRYEANSTLKQILQSCKAPTTFHYWPSEQEDEHRTWQRVEAVVSSLRNADLTPREEAHERI